MEFVDVILSILSLCFEMLPKYSYVFFFHTLSVTFSIRRFVSHASYYNIMFNNRMLCSGIHKFTFVGKSNFLVKND